VSAGASLYIVGSAISLFSGRSAFLGGVRMLVIGAIAATVTYLIGAAV
jgi:VIT1/CCC1 family predicted Fe2+/Mn2+ transporter